MYVLRFFFQDESQDLYTSVIGLRIKPECPCWTAYPSKIKESMHLSSCFKAKAIRARMDTLSILKSVRKMRTLRAEESLQPQTLMKNKESTPIQYRTNVFFKNQIPLRSWIQREEEDTSSCYDNRTWNNNRALNWSTESIVEKNECSTWEGRNTNFSKRNTWCNALTKN